MPLTLSHGVFFLIFLWKFKFFFPLTGLTLLEFFLVKTLIDTEGSCLLSFSSVGPRVYLAKIPFLAFFG